MSINTKNRTKGTSLSKDKIKVEVKEKVREIRLRQQNWMKQRQEEQHEETCDRRRQSSSSTTGNIKHGSNKTTNTDFQNPVSAVAGAGRQLQQTDMKILAKGNFKTWLESRNNNSKGGNSGVLSNETLMQEDGGETNLLRLNSWRTAESATPEPGWTRDQVLGPVSNRSDLTLQGELSPPLSEYGRNSRTTCEADNTLPAHYEHIEYEALADHIISRVKQTLDIRRGDGDGQINTTDRSSLTCNSVDLQLSAERLPMLISPCGHTACAACVRGRQLCIVCNSPVASSMVNLMLQQIIEGFRQERLDRGRQPTQIYQPQQYSEPDYSEKYSNLKMRHEVLSQQGSMLRQDVSSITRLLQKEEKQLVNIGREEARLTNEIAELRSRLEGLWGHKAEYKVKVDKLIQQKQEKDRQLTLVQDSIYGLQKEMEKIELLSDCG